MVAWPPTEDSNLARRRLTAGRRHLDDSMGMVDRRGVEPHPPVCRTSVLPLSLATHQMVPGRGFDPRSLRLQRSAFTRLAFRAWCGRRESNSNLKSGALALCLRAASAWWVPGRVERLARRGPRLQRGEDTGPPYWRNPNGCACPSCTDCLQLMGLARWLFLQRAMNWRSADVSIAMPLGTHPFRTGTGGRSG